MVAGDRQRIRVIGLKFQAIPARLSRDIDEGERLFQIAVVICTDLSDQQGFFIPPDGFAFDV